MAPKVLALICVALVRSQGHVVSLIELMGSGSGVRGEGVGGAYGLPILSHARFYIF